MSTATKQLIEAPTSDGSYEYKTLGYVEAYDAPINSDYAFVAYKETEKSGGAWRVKIKSKQTAGAVFEPDMMKSKARETGAQGKPFFKWGYSFEPTAGDPRCIEFRVHVRDGKPSEIEMFVQTRTYDGKAGEAKSVKFAWPE